MLFLSVSSLSLQAGAPPVHRASRHAVVRAAAADYLKEIEQGPPDAILGIAANFRASTAENKVNVAVGAYRTNEGVPWVLPSVREAEQRILAAFFVFWNCLPCRQYPLMFLSKNFPFFPPH